MSSPVPRRASASLALAMVIATLAVPVRASATIPVATAPSALTNDSARSSSAGRPASSGAGWLWPLPHVRLVAGYAAPANPYAAGHRGVDLAGATGAVVRAPARGSVAFAGAVAGRPVLTIDHGDGLVTTLEPVSSALVPGTPVAVGDEVGVLSVGGHAEAGTLHFGVRLNGEYIDPMLMFDRLPRAVLLPCCS